MKRRVHISREQLEPYVKQGMNGRQIAAALGQAYGTVKKRLKEHGLKTCYVQRCSPETRKLLSDLAKRRIKERPETLHALNKGRNKSPPCEHLKQWLRDQGLVFVEEYQPLLHKDRFFSLDIAFPDKRIGIEVNGNQHYNPDGTLAPYYQTRHDLIEAEGWLLYELHFSTCYHIEAIAQLLPSILSSSTKVEFDYGAYFVNRKRRKLKLSEIDPNWRHRPRPGAQMHTWPDKETLGRLIWKKTLRQIAAGIGCSDVGLKKCCLKYGIVTPPQGYWRRLEAGYTHEEALTSQGRRRDRATGTKVRGRPGS